MLGLCNISDQWLAMIQSSSSEASKVEVTHRFNTWHAQIMVSVVAYTPETPRSYAMVV